MYWKGLESYDKDDDKDVNLFVHVFDDQQHRAVQASHIPVQSLQAAPMDGYAVDQLPWIALGPCWHVSSKLLEKEVFIKTRHTERYRNDYHIASRQNFC